MSVIVENNIEDLRIFGEGLSLDYKLSLDLKNSCLYKHPLSSKTCGNPYFLVI